METDEGGTKLIKAKKGFIIRRMNDSYMILAVGSAGEQFKDILQTNETGAFYWHLLEKGTSLDEMVKASMEHFEDLDETTARQDIEEYLQNISDAVEDI